MSDRDMIRNIRFARQRADFKGMRFGTITPTDIDGFVEFGDEVFVFMEVKHGSTELPDGQRLALERVCDRVQRGGGEAIVLILRNEASRDESPTFKLGPLPVLRSRYKFVWRDAKTRISATQAIERFATEKLGRTITAANAATAPQSNDEWLRDYEVERAA